MLSNEGIRIMSAERLSGERRPSRKRGSLRMAAALTVAALTGGATGVIIDRAADTTYLAAGEAGREASSDARDAAVRAAESAVAMQHTVDVADGATAVVVFDDNSHENIENPILVKVYRDAKEGINGDMKGDSEVIPLERTSGSDAGEGQLFTGYKVGVDGVAEINYFGPNTYQEGDEDTQNLDTTHMSVERAPGTADAAQYMLGTDTAGAQVRVADGHFYDNKPK